MEDGSAPAVVFVAGKLKQQPGRIGKSQDLRIARSSTRAPSHNHAMRALALQVAQSCILFIIKMSLPLQGFPIFNSPIKARMFPEMNEPTDSLDLAINQLASELRLLEKRLRLEPDPSADALTEFRHALDDARLTAWSVSTLITAGRPSQVRNAALAFVAAERIRRVEQLLKNICGDIEGRAISLQKDQMDSLLNSVNSLREVLMHSLAKPEHL
jgi:hypothetical protein